MGITEFSSDPQAYISRTLETPGKEITHGHYDDETDGDDAADTDAEGGH